MHEALGDHVKIPRPARWENIEQAPQRVEVLPNNADAVKMLMRERLS